MIKLLIRDLSRLLEEPRRYPPSVLRLARLDLRNFSVAMAGLAKYLDGMANMIIVEQEQRDEIARDFRGEL